MVLILVKQLQGWNYKLIDCQISSEHLESLGAIEISREKFRQQLHELLPRPGKAPPWELDAI